MKQKKYQKVYMMLDGEDPQIHLSRPWPKKKWNCVFATSVCDDCYNDQGIDNPCREAWNEMMAARAKRRRENRGQQV